MGVLNSLWLYVGSFKEEVRMKLDLRFYQEEKEVDGVEGQFQKR